VTPLAPVLQTHALSCSFGTTRALVDVDLRAGSGRWPGPCSRAGVVLLIAVAVSNLAARRRQGRGALT
jgi:hypothetical protein